jgi:hypothetical protein
MAALGLRSTRAADAQAGYTERVPDAASVVHRFTPLQEQPQAR